MIVAMSRVLAVGPKRLLAPVLEVLQGIGSLHVDRIEGAEVPQAFTTAGPDAGTRPDVETLERLRARADGLLALLPPVPGDAAPATDEFAGRSPDDLAAELTGLEEEIQPLTRRRLEIQDELELIRSYEGAVRVLSPLLGALAGSATVETVGFILRTRDLSIVQQFRRQLEELTGGRVEVVSRMIEEGKIGVVVAFHRRDAEAVRGFLTRAGVSELRLPSAYATLPPAEAISTMEQRRSALPAELERVNAELQALARRARSRLVAIRAVLADRLARLQVIPQLVQSRYTFVVHGWTPTRTVAAIRRTLERRFGKEVVVYDTPADPHEAERVPVLLDNRPVIKPFQLLLGPLPPPVYGSWDPSPLFALTFPMFVGLVIGDVGFGLLIFALGWLLRNRARTGKGLDAPALNLSISSSMMAAISWLVRIVALWIIAFGVVYAEAFGNLPELLFHVKPFFDRVHETDVYFRVIILLGVVMMYLGLFIHLIMAIAHRHLEGILETVVLTFGSLALLIFLATQRGYLPSPLAPWAGYFLLVALVGLGGALLLRKWMSAMWLLEAFTVFGHIVSHARLMAFGLAAAALAIAANRLGERAGAIGVVGAVLVAGIFQLLFFVLTLMGHIMQPARLHWVEFLTKLKYYDHPGRRYKPLQRTGGG